MLKIAKKLSSSDSNKTQIFYYTPCFNEVPRGVNWYHLVRLSVCPFVDRIVSALYLQQYSSDPFHICTSYQATSEFGEFFKFVTLTLSSFDLGSNRLNGMGNNEAVGVSSERRPSSCSSWSWIGATNIASDKSYDGNEYISWYIEMCRCKSSL